MVRRWLAGWLLALLLLIALDTLPMGAPLALAKKKKKGPSEEEVKAAVQPVQQRVTQLLSKIQSHLLFTPKDNETLEEVKWQMMDLVAQYPDSPLMVQPTYQAAILFVRREWYEDAYDLLSHIATTYPDHPLAPKANLEISKLSKRFGADMFAVATPAASPAAGAKVALAKT
jgi:TolA-binding protein